MESDRRLAQSLEKFRPVLVTLAEALIAPAFRGSLEASDIVQQTLLEAGTGTQEAESIIDQGDGAFFAWLRQALRNNVLDAVKHLTAQKNDVRRNVSVSVLEESFVRLDQVVAADDTSPSQVVQRNEQVEVMLAAMQDLPANQRMALVLKHLRGQSLQEVAEALGLSESAVAGLLHRGRQQLAKRLEAQGHD